MAQSPVKTAERKKRQEIMSAVCILAPVVIAAWPAFSAAVVAAATSLGYQVAREAAREPHARAVARNDSTQVGREIERSEVVTHQRGRAQRTAVTREGVPVTLARDARGKAPLCVPGQGHSREELLALGEELSQRVV